MAGIFDSGIFDTGIFDTGVIAVSEFVGDGVDKHRKSRIEREQEEIAHREELKAIVRRAYDYAINGPPVPNVEKAVVKAALAEAKLADLDLSGIELSVEQVQRLIREYEATIAARRERDNNALALLLLSM